MAWQLFETRIGWCGLAWNAHGVFRLQLPDVDRRATEIQLRQHLPAGLDTMVPPPISITNVIAELLRYLAGEPIEFSSVAVDFGDRGAAERKIYAALRAVHWGETVTYGELAQRAGLPGAAQAVGVAMAKNPVPVIIPCHRVLAARGRIGGFSAPGGTATKERLLALEGVFVDGGEPRLPGL
jgi:methylated-DNA-[protein]-cysteine S-methyltransferase